MFGPFFWKNNSKMLHSHHDFIRISKDVNIPIIKLDYFDRQIKPLMIYSISLKAPQLTIYATFTW